MDMDRYIGRLLDNRYEILEVIGSGGMSVVYKARCHRLNRLVAVKILKDENSEDEDFRRRFHAESQAVAMLSHPNIVSVYDVSTTEDADYIVMELIEGITLKQYMQKKGVLNWKETLHFATQIAKALEHAHSRGLVHRDIKPHNVMVLKNGSVKVADFGIARIMSQCSTQTKEALGSVHYISPEQAKGGRVDNRSDLYSLGVVMYEMITGRPPYDGESPVAVAIQHINGGASLPSTLNPNIPKGLEQIIVKAMSRDLRKRYPSATAMLYDLDEFRKNPDIDFSTAAAPADPNGATRVLTGIAGTIGAEQKEEKAGTVSAPMEPVRRKKEESGGKAAIVAVVVCSIVAILAVVLVGVLLWGNRDDTPTTVRVPNLLGEHFDSLGTYEGIEVIRQSSEYSEEYAVGQIIRQSPTEGRVLPYGSKVYVIVSLGPEPAPILMPEVEGQTFEGAKQILDDLGLDIYVKRAEDYSSTVPTGKIIRCDPVAGTKLTGGMTVTLTVSLGAKSVKAEMPDLLKNTGWDKETAEGILERRGFTNVKWEPVDSLLKEGRIVSQSIPAGEVIDVTTLIVVEYSNGNPPEGTGDSETEVTVTHTLKDLPLREEPYKVSVIMNDVAVVVGLEVPAGETSVQFQITGSGTQQCTVYIDGEFYQTITVVFEADE